MNVDITQDQLIALSNGIPPELLSLRNLIHEEVHAVSVNTFTKYNETEIEYTTGYSITKGKASDMGDGTIKIDSTHFFRLFDEAVTERLAREITQ